MEENKIVFYYCWLEIRGLYWSTITPCYKLEELEKLFKGRLKHRAASIEEIDEFIAHDILFM